MKAKKKLQEEEKDSDATDKGFEDKVYSPFLQRTLMVDPPSNLMINIKRYFIKDGKVAKDHTFLEFKPSIFLDDIMLHRVPKRNEVF